jgi:acyl-CoA synthetase (AMP-forming)/AMP-acid ligase II
VLILNVDQVYFRPQCTEHAVSHLLKITECTHVLHSSSLTELVALSKPKSCKNHTLLDIPVSQTAKRYITPAGIAGSTIAYVHHTSGTSTGLPKPIPQTHAAATLYLPCLPPASPTAAFTTTPLYHGGTADLMRSLMSSSLLWLYPPSVPLISGNIIKVLQVAERDKLPIKLFTAVPYVIEICAGREEVMKRMVEMDMVGVGGAPLEAEVGAKLIKRGVKLISRFGSSECGCTKLTYNDLLQY